MKQISAQTAAHQLVNSQCKQVGIMFHPNLLHSNRKLLAVAFTVQNAAEQTCRRLQMSKEKESAEPKYACLESAVYAGQEKQRVHRIGFVKIADISSKYSDE